MARNKHRPDEFKKELVAKVKANPDKKAELLIAAKISRSTFTNWTKKFNSNKEIVPSTERNSTEVLYKKNEVIQNLQTQILNQDLLIGDLEKEILTLYRLLNHQKGE